MNNMNNMILSEVDFLEEFYKSEYTISLSLVTTAMSIRNQYLISGTISDSQYDLLNILCNKVLNELKSELKLS